MKTQVLKTFLISIILISYSIDSISQQTIYDETTFVYKREISGGLHLQGHGAGLFFTKSKQKTVSKFNRWSIELSTVKHPKEFKDYYRYSENAKGFFFGKKNSLIMLRPTWGRKTIISEKYRKQGVSMSTNFAIGPAIAFLKPVYIEYIYGTPMPLGQYDVLRTERFDIEKHGDINRIYGRAPFVKGISETSAQIGLHAKMGVDFEYSPYQTGVKGIETGIMVDIFSKPVEIMDLRDIKNKKLFLSLYLNIYFGKKYNNIDKG